MQSQKALKNSEYRFLDYILTPDNQLIKNMTFIRTGAKELAVLRALIESAGKLMTKDKLLDQVWGTTFVSEESLARCIYILRKIFKQNTSQALIQTVYSKGYIFVAEVKKNLEAENVIDEIENVEPLLTSSLTLPPTTSSTPTPTPKSSSAFQDMLINLFGNNFSFFEVLGQKHIAIEIKISLPSSEDEGNNINN